MHKHPHTLRAKILTAVALQRFSPSRVESWDPSVRLPLGGWILLRTDGLACLRVNWLPNPLKKKKGKTKRETNKIHPMLLKVLFFIIFYII